jgi:hypothetical protein
MILTLLLPVASYVYCALIPEARTMGPHFAISAFTNAAKACGDC